MNLRVAHHFKQGVVHLFHLDYMENHATIPVVGMKEDLLRRIERKQQEIKELELKARDANAYMQGLQDALRMLPKESDQPEDEPTLRPGTDLAKARDALLKAQRPLHITDILRAIGKSNDKRSRLALAGSIARYARKGSVFTKAGPNTFGLPELPQQRVGNEPPDDFGVLETISGTRDQLK